MLDPELLAILCCPETRQPLSLANAEQVAKWNAKIAQGAVFARAGTPILEPIEGLLIRQDGRFGYVVRHDIPVMLIDEALPLTSEA